jgi:hypothetical protein
VQGEAEEYSQDFLNKFLNIEEEKTAEMAEEGLDLEKTPMTEVRFDDTKVGLHPKLLKSLSKMKNHTVETKIQRS